jgi:inorganic pyrophosphatase/exopolyphosphatase
MSRQAILDDSKTPNEIFVVGDVVTIVTLDEFKARTWTNGRIRDIVDHYVVLDCSTNFESYMVKILVSAIETIDYLNKEKKNVNN